MAKGALQSTTKTRREDVDTKAWAIAQRLGVFGYAEIQIDLSISPDAATKIVRAWEAEGRIVLKQGGNSTGRKKFEIAKTHREPQDRAGQVALQLWNGMRGLKTFSPAELAAHCRAELAVKADEASEYCQALLRAGYLRVHQTAIPDVRPARYILINNTGLRAPRERRVRAVWDENTGTFAYVAGAGRIGSPT